VTYEDRVPPHDLGAERAVISAAALSPEACDELLGILRPEDFYADPHRRIWGAVGALREAGEVVELTAIASRLLQTRGGGSDGLQAVGGPAALVEIVEATAAITNAALHARTVRDLARLRAAGLVFRRLHAESFGVEGDVGQWLQGAEAQVYAATAAEDSQDGGVWFRDDVREGLEDVERARTDGGRTLGITTGFRCLDDHLGGLASGDLWFVAGRPGQGKTALADAIVEASAEQGFAWCKFSLEMSRAKLRSRSLSRASLIPTRALRRGELSREQWQRLADAAARLTGLPIYTDDAGTLTPAMLRAKTRRWLAETRRVHPNAKIGGVLVDHVQLMQDDGRHANRNEELTKCSRSLKQLAKEFGLPVIACSQLNRPIKGAKVPRPQPTDLRESGALEQDADVVLFVHRPSEYTGEPVVWPDTAEIVVGKGRDAGSGLHRLLYDGPTTRFYEDDRTSDQDPREPPLGRSWSPRDGSPRPAPQPWHEPPERDDPDEPDEYGIPRSL